MKKELWIAGLVLAAIFVVGSISANAELVQKADNFLIILDVSRNMSDHYKGDSKWHHAQRTARYFVTKIPEGTSINGGLRTFGNKGSEKTKMVIPMRSYDKDYFKQTVKLMDNDKGFAKLSIALDAAKYDLSGLSGKTAIIVITDGLDQDRAVNTKAAKALQKQYGDNVCIYTILVGKSRPGAENLRDVAKASKCGFSTSWDVLQDKNRVEDYVKMVLFEQSNRDTDGDGVSDNDDYCPGTPWGASVNMRGCWIIPGIQFDTDSAMIKSMYYPTLNEVISVLGANPEIKLEIQGHTDDQGDDGYNMGLSQRRAESVQAYLISNGVESSRLKAVGYGESSPVDTNATTQGRAQNRRIELRLMQ